MFTDFTLENPGFKIVCPIKRHGVGAGKGKSVARCVNAGLELASGSRWPSLFKLAGEGLRYCASPPLRPLVAHSRGTGSRKSSVATRVNR